MACVVSWCYLTNNQTKPMTEINQITGIQLNSIQSVLARAKQEIREITGRKCELMFYMEKAEITVSMEYIMATVSECFGIPVEDIKSEHRGRFKVQARQAYFYLCKKHTKVSLKPIGKSCGGRDHSTVLHGDTCVKETLIHDDVFMEKLNNAEAKILTIKSEQQPIL